MIEMRLHQFIYFLNFLFAVTENKLASNSNFSYPLKLLTMNSGRSDNERLNYQRFTPEGWKDKVCFRKLEFFSVFQFSVPLSLFLPYYILSFYFTFCFMPKNSFNLASGSWQLDSFISSIKSHSLWKTLYIHLLSGLPTIDKTVKTTWNSLNMTISRLN